MKKAVWIEHALGADIRKIAEIAEAQAQKIMHGERVKVLSILPSISPEGYAVVVESLG